MSLASVVVTQRVSLEAALEEEADHHSGLPAPMSDQETGTAVLATAEPTTLLAAPAASSVVHSRTMVQLEAMTVTCLAPEVSV